MRKGREGDSARAVLRGTRPPNGAPLAEGAGARKTNAQESGESP